MTHVHPYWKWLRSRKGIMANRIYFATGVHATFTPPHNHVDQFTVCVSAAKHGRALLHQDMRIKDIENGTLQALLMLVAGDG